MEGMAERVTQTSSGEDMLELQRIDGKFASTTAISGTYELWNCGGPGGNYHYPSSKGTWNAEWKSQ
jgi:hypothetical protein